MAEGAPAAEWPPVPVLWPGETVVIAASGPSLTREQLEYVRGKARLIVINTTYRLAPWADLLYACDGKWWELWQGVPEFEGIKVSQDAAAEKWGVKRVPGEDAPGISLDPHRIHFGMNSGHQAINLSVHLAGPGRRVLIGFDMREGPGGALHWHGNHPSPLANPRGRFVDWAERMAESAPMLKDAGVEVLNCTPGSALDCFPMARLEDVL